MRPLYWIALLLIFAVTAGCKVSVDTSELTAVLEKAEDRRKEEREKDRKEEREFRRKMLDASAGQLKEARGTNVGLLRLATAQNENASLLKRSNDEKLGAILAALDNSSRPALPATPGGVVRADPPVPPEPPTTEIKENLDGFTATGESLNNALDQLIGFGERWEKLRGVDPEKYRELKEELEKTEAENEKLRARKPTIINKSRQEVAPPPTEIYEGPVFPPTSRYERRDGRYCYPSYHSYYTSPMRRSFAQQVYDKHHTDEVTRYRHFAH